MQYLAVPGNAWNKSTAPEMFFFDAAKDNVDLAAASVGTTEMTRALREARTVLGANNATMITRGQKGSVYYLTELAKNIGNTELPDLITMARNQSPYYGIHASWVYGNGISNTSNRVISLVPVEAENQTANLPMLGVRSAIAASRTYRITVTVRISLTSGSLQNSYSYGDYRPASSSSGGTVHQAENNTFSIPANITHIGWPFSISVSDTGYGPTIVYPTVSADVRGVRIKQQVKPSNDVFNLTEACLHFSGFMVRLYKGVDYDVQDDCVAGSSYEIDFTKCRKLISL